MTDKQTWVNGWGLGVARPPLTETQWTKNTTVRYVLHNTLNASALRLFFTNRFTDTKTVLSHVTVAKSTDGKCKTDADSITDVTFGGGLTGTMEPHGDIVSDAIPFEIRAGEALAVSIYYADFTQMTTGFTYDNQYMPRFFIEGDAAAEPDFDFYKRSFSAAYHFLWSIDFLCDASAYSVAAFGDSWTSQEWVDILNRKLTDNGIGNRALVRRAVSGSRIFGSYPALSYYHYGEDGMTRFERETVHSGVKKVIILHGINDIIHPDGKNPLRPIKNLPTAGQIEDAYRLYTDTAHRHGIMVYFATILPIKGWRSYTPEKDEIRRAVNRIIRTQTFADGFFDFEEAVRDSLDPCLMKKEYNRGDNLHMNVAGYEKIADTVPLDFFL